MASSQSIHGQLGIPPGFEDTPVASVPSPTSLAFTPDGRLLIGSQWGQVYVYADGGLLGTPALDLGPVACNYRERGLLGLAVDPDFALNQFIYVSYIFNKFGNCDAETLSTPVGRVSRFRMSGNTVDPTSELVLLDNVPSPVGVHNLDDVEFGRDGYLYVTIGDGGCDYAGNSGCFSTNDAARDMNALSGKLLRITRDGGIPPDNPFTGSGTVRCNTDGVAAPGLVCQEIFATGLRNPWRIAFDPNAAGTRFFINDVGQDQWEEINEGIAGADYGWNIREGFCLRDATTECSAAPPPGLTNPVFAYDRSDGCSSVTGGAFVPNGEWPAAFNGSYLFSDFVCGQIFKLVRAADGSYARETFVTGLGEFSAVDILFGPHAGGTALYYATFGNGGEIRRIAFVGDANQQPVANASATPAFGPPPLVVDFDGSGSSDPDGDALTYAWDFGDGGAASGPAAQHTYSSAGTYTATLRVTDPDGAASTSTVRIDVGNTPPNPVIVTPTADQRFAVGEAIVLQGRATDAEDGALPDSALTWRVLLHHNTHTHPFLFTPDANNVTFHAPGPENLEAAATSYLDLQLTATDSRGSTRTVAQTLMPRTAQLQFLSNPSGATLRIDDGLVTTPASFASWVNYGVAVEAPSQIGPAGAPLVFASWSDGGAASHTITTPESATSYTAQFTGAPASASNAYNGTPVTLPGTIEVENFDRAPDNLAYSDTTAANSGGQYRLTGVDIEGTSDQGGGYNVGWAFAGEWLNYTVNVGTAGVYDVDVRVASNGAGGTFHIEVDGVDKTGPLTVPNTGGWQNWISIRRSGVSLGAGLQVWRVVMDDNGATTAVGNFNFIGVTSSSNEEGGAGSTPFGGIPWPLPGVVEAENFDEGGSGVAYSDTTPQNAGGQYRDTAVDIELTEGAPNQYNVGWMFAGEWLNYTVGVATAGSYDIEARVASAGAGGTFHIEANGVDKTGPLTVPDTGGWQAWTIVRASGVSLDAGVQTLTLVMDVNGATTAVGNVDWIRVSANASSGLLRGPYLQQVSDGSAIVVWTTREHGAQEVHYRGPDGFTVVSAAETRAFPATQTGFGFDFYQHEAPLSGLLPATRYSYDVFDGATYLTSGQEVFSTAPATGTGTVRFIAFGDSGVGSNAQRELATRMTSETFDLALHSGDVAYGTADGAGGGSYRQFDDWFFGIYAPWLRSHPVFPSIGNHDDEVQSAQAYRDVFVLPRHGATAAYPDDAERYYSFDYGPVHFVALDTELAFLDPARRQAQLAWLEADLSATRQPWRVVFLHRPPYNAGAHHGSALDVRQAFGPILERYHVQLVVAGHEHDYERSVPWRESASPSGAVTYVVTGGGGAVLYPSGMDRWTATSASVHHYVRATVADCVLRLEAVRVDGAIFDTYSLDRCAQATDATAPQVAIVTPANGAPVSGTITVEANASDDVRVEKVDFHVDGVLRAVDTAAPYRWTLDTRTLADGAHAIEARAYDVAGRITRSTAVSINVLNGVTASDVVLYASDVSVMRGNWTRVASSGAGGFEMSSDDRGVAATAVPTAAPADYFEAAFTAPAGTYRIWLRLRAAADSKFNESVWVQLSDATNSAGAPLWRIGSDQALLVNLEDCGGCGVSSWGWQDNAWWLDESSMVRFATSGTHTIRIQTREDGVKIDQIVLSPSRFVANAPGAVRNDTTIVSK